MKFTKFVIYLFAIFFIFVLFSHDFLTNKNIINKFFFEKRKINFIFRTTDVISISVLVPIYNKYKYLNISFNSVQNQTLQNLELVAVDDYSNDQSSEFVLQRMKSDNRIKLVQHYYTQGTCNSRIHGAMSCKGKYIMSLDPDDLFYLNATEISYQKAIKLNADVIDILAELRHKANIIRGWMPCKSNFSQNDKILHSLKVFNFGILPWNIWRKIVKNKIYQKAVQLMLPFVKDKRITIGEDLIHCGCIFMFSNNFYCTFFIGYIYNYGLPQTSHTDAYQTAVQNNDQKKFSVALLRFFLQNKGNLDSINLSDFLNSSIQNYQLYKNISNVVKSPNKTKCEINIQGFKSDYYEKFGYCLIRRIN